MSSSRHWDDLFPRVITGGMLIVSGVAGIWFGGWVFAIMVALATGVMIMELTGVVADRGSIWAVPIGLVASVCILLSREAEFSYVIAYLLIPAILGSERYRERYVMFFIFALSIMVASHGLIKFRDQWGALLTFWLVSSVVATDIAGYFGGRFIGGRKFWPSVSPAKTWAGVVSGWFVAALVGLAFAQHSGVGVHLVWISVLISFASQLGDLAESGMKRLTDIKHSSGLLPGHGGFLDRFDGLVGAAVFVILAQYACQMLFP